MRFMLLGEPRPRSLGNLWDIQSDWWSFGSTHKDMAIKPEFSKYEPTLEKGHAVDKSEA